MGINYYVAAIGLKVISSSGYLQSIYRRAGNQKKARPITIKFTQWVWEQSKDYLHSGCKILELGTGWTHANSLYIALIGNAKIHAFDVADIRSLHKLKYQIPFVLAAIESGDHAEDHKNTARQRARAVLAADHIDDVYQILNIEYQVRPSGIPDYTEKTFDVIFSVDVLEHVRREDFISLAHVWRYILKPSGLFIAQVGLDDHLQHYDKKKNLKHYLQHSNLFWRRVLQNKIQYINRLTMNEIISIFKTSGYALLSTTRETCDISQLKIHPYYQGQPKEDLETHRLLFTARKAA